MSTTSRLGPILRALPGMYRVGLAGALAYRSEFFIWVLTTNMPLVMLALWSAVAREAPVGPYRQADFAAYFVATLIVRLLTSSWVVWEMNFEIKQGTLAMRLLRPIHPFISYASDNLAALPMRVVLALPIATVALLVLGAGHLAKDWFAWASLPLALALAWSVNFSVMTVIGTLGVFIESSLAIFDGWLALFFVFSGYTMPLDLLPRGILSVVRWLPFRFILSFPVEIITGRLSRTEIAVGLATQFAYAALFVVGGLAMWRAAVRRFAAFGG